MHANANTVNLFVEHTFDNNLIIRNQARYATYDKQYQNIYASGPVTGTSYAVSAYNNAQQRDNYYNQTDLIGIVNTGPIRHNVLLGVRTGPPGDRQHSLHRLLHRCWSECHQHQRLDLRRRASMCR